MEPVSLLVAALVAGAKSALTETASAAIRDAYGGLKALLVRKFGKRASIESLEEKPESKKKQDAVQEDLLDAGAPSDPELMAKAQELVGAVERDDPETARSLKALGLDLKGIKAEFLKVGNIRSADTGAWMRDSEFTGGITLGDISAGVEGPLPDPPKRQGS